MKSGNNKKFGDKAKFLLFSVHVCRRGSNNQWLKNKIK